MELTPIDITQREFQRRFRGLDPVEVRTFLDGVAEELQRLLKENAFKEERVQKLETQLHHYQQRDRELKEALLAVHRMADEVKEKARKEADLILK
ncbi:MAG: DivIVA domain-containing protein, partial [Candidatus Methylomirabilales bacterium]